MSKGRPMSPVCPSSPTSPSPPPVSLSYSNWPRKRVSLSAPKKNPIAVPIPHLQKQYCPVSVNHLSNNVTENIQENFQNKIPPSSPTPPIQHHVIKGRISPILVARKGFAHLDVASQQLMGKKATHPLSSPNSSSSIPIPASPPSTAISTRTARPSFARRTSTPSLLVSALVASHTNSREKLCQDAGGPKSTSEKEISSYRSSRIPVASVALTGVSEKSPEATATILNNMGDRGKTPVRKSCGALVRPALKHLASDSDMSGISIRRKSVQFEAKFERIRLFLEAETPHSVTFSPTSLGPEPKKDAGSIVLPNFPPLTTCYHSKPVSVESVSLSLDGTHIHGLVQVQNIAYEKMVRARYTFDCWNTAQEAVAHYKEPIIRSDSNHRGLDRFEFTLPIPQRLDSGDDETDLWRTMYLAVQYQVAGAQYWDSNSGQNYQVNIRQPPPQYFNEDKGEEVDEGIFEISDLGIVDDDSKENSSEVPSQKFPCTGPSIKQLPSPCSSASDFGYFSPKPSPLSAIPSTGTIPLRTTKKNLGNRYDFGASLAATVRPRNTSPSLPNSMYHRPSSPLSFSSFSSSQSNTSSSSLSTSTSPIPTSSTSTLSSSPYSPFSAIALSVTTSALRSPTTFSTLPLSSSSSVEAPISSTPWEERARTAAVAYCRPSSPSCDFSSTYSSSYDSPSFPGIPSAWTSYSPSVAANSFDGMYPSSVNLSYSPLSSPYSSSPPATAIWG